MGASAAGKDSVSEIGPDEEYIMDVQDFDADGYVDPRSYAWIQSSQCYRR